MTPPIKLGFMVVCGILSGCGGDRDDEIGGSTAALELEVEEGTLSVDERTLVESRRARLDEELAAEPGAAERTALRVEALNELSEAIVSARTRDGAPAPADGLMRLRAELLASPEAAADAREARQAAVNAGSHYVPTESDLENAERLRRVDLTGLHGESEPAGGR